MNIVPTAAEILSRDRLLLKGEMKKISEKWEERTEGPGTIWPMGGTFDPIMYRDMEVVIRNYIDNRSGKTALAKRDREKLVLALFLEEGERCRTLQRVAGEKIANNKKAQPLPLKVEPPLYKPVSVYPLLKGMVAIKGEVTLDEEDKQCNTQGRRGAPIHMDCYEGIRNAGEECDDTETSSSESKDEDKNSGDEHVEEDGNTTEQNYKGLSSRIKRRGKNTKKRTKSQRRQKKRSESNGGESSRVDQALEEPCCSTALQGPLALETQEKTRRSHRERKAPDTLPGNYPILINGQQAFSPPIEQPQSQQSPNPPITHVHIHNYGNPTNKNRKNRNEGPQGQFRNNQQHGSQGQRSGPLICYGCNQEGHSKKNCLINPFPPQRAQGNGNQGQAGPFMG
ncbi:uncharacterized protein LOC132463610 [Gadus macrocephalus]|uniref:uncharacterized protein LOC132463610 n=1 Tax=Gadus macrocephalus TaxID=80720 RepID=UPI0028CBADD2|nr:uncharacterized protein LOC132463610 [Gadus macrocephalus]XP_059915875.1 uncharacterized protein LOC132463610 [Gadus macrocephalus]XP_059915876.1 uncharacterized protein LOC132463610 [Gadus macrocephalus]